MTHVDNLDTMSGGRVAALFCCKCSSGADLLPRVLKHRRADVIGAVKVWLQDLPAVCEQPVMQGDLNVSVAYRVPPGSVVGDAVAVLSCCTVVAVADRHMS